MGSGVAVEARGWVGELLDPRTVLAAGPARLEALDAPPGFQGELRGYQQRGVGWLTFLIDPDWEGVWPTTWGWGRRSSTLPSCSIVDAAWGAEAVSADLPDLGGWQLAARAGAVRPELRVLVHHGPERASGERPFGRKPPRSTWSLTSYALLHRDRETLAGFEWDGVVLDEAQNVKNAATLQARAARSLTAGYRFALTGRRSRTA